MDYSSIFKKYKKKPIFDKTSKTAEPVNYGLEDIFKLIPNRPPFIYLDKITHIDIINETICGNRLIDPNDPVFLGHFPGNPVYPGVLQLEIISELFCCLYYFMSNNTHLITNSNPVNLRATRMYECVLQKGVFPGDLLQISTKLIENNNLTFTGLGQITRDDEICVTVIGEFYII